MNKILSRVTAGSAAAITVAAGLTGVVGAASYNGHGGHHRPQPSYWSKTYDLTSLKNKAYIDVANTNDQSASTGRVEAEDNTTVGSVSSGAASNSNGFNASVSVDNSSSSAAALSAARNSAPVAPVMGGSHHSTPVTTKISDVSKTYVNNFTDVDLTNTNTQTATSGSVEVEDNSTVGDVSSGAATNTNTATVSISVTN